MSAPELTRIERDVCRLILTGASNREIARQRGTAVRTVANQVASILKKTGAGSRAQLPLALVARSCTNEMGSVPEPLGNGNAQSAPRPAFVAVLSVRERQALRCMTLGHSTKEAASALGISATTVTLHLWSARRKLGIKSRVELVSLMSAASL
jgi:DNA-binding CsgD family transcriptional regulator